MAHRTGGAATEVRGVDGPHNRGAEVSPFADQFK